MSYKNKNLEELGKKINNLDDKKKLRKVRKKKMVQDLVLRLALK